MYLKKLELQGFKSFANKTSLEFMPGITTVIGPNGSGKSNISDAIRWVLGEQSMKSLRGTKSEDIIFAGTENRKSQGFAEVSLVIDNQDAKLPIEFAEVTITRRLYRSGETGYFINKAPCRLKDILELIMDTGIGKDGYSIIGQGKIDEILSNKSEDRRGIFEEAAGIIKYRTRKAESEKKLEQAKLNLLRVNDILSEIEVNLDPLKLQAEKAKKFLSLRDELKTIEIGLFLVNIESYKVKLKELLKNIDELNFQIDDENVNLNNLQQEKDKIKQGLDDLIISIEEMQNLSFESTNKIEKINADINVARERITNNKENFDRYLKEIEEQETRKVELNTEKEERQNKKINLSTNKEKFTKELEEKEKMLAEITAKLSQEETEIEGKKKIVEESQDLKYDKREGIKTQEIVYENLVKREKVLQQELQETISELDEKRLYKTDIAKVFTKIEAKRNEYSKKIEEIEEKKTESSKRVAEFEAVINNLESEIRVKNSKCKFLQEMEKEKEGYQKAIKEILLECDRNAFLKKGVHDVLANLITVPKEYETAIEIALGGTLQNIVTDTEEDAKKLIEYLRKNNLGRASFLPISSVKGKKVDHLIKNGLSGVIGIASDLVKTAPKYEEIILNLLGKTVVVEDMDTAIILARQNKYGFKIVTLKGDIINPSGAISGGSIKPNTTNIIGRAGQIKDLLSELSKLEKNLEKVKNEKKEYIKSITSILEQAETIEKEAQSSEITYATEKQKVESIEEAIAKLENKLANLKKESLDIEKTKEQTLITKARYETEIKELEQKMETLNGQISVFAEKNKDNQKYIDDLNFDITNLKISVSSFDESANSLDEIIARIDQDILNIEKGITVKKEQRIKIEQDNKMLEEQITNLNNQIEEIKQNVNQSVEKVEELKKKRQEENSRLDNVELSIAEKLKLLENLKGEISKLDIKKSKIDVELEQIEQKMWEDYEITPNNAEQEFEKPKNVQTTTKRVKELKEQIKNLGSINIDSIEEYRQTKERYDFMCEQRLDLEDSSAKLRKVIQDMTKIMKEQFAEKFNIINKNFGEVFKELFGGGKAELKLTDEENILECGIDIEVQPPGKKLQNMTLLSGGEKAFTAIALLFAILKINPAPFCVLDEIEAALDDVNVYRFAEYLKKFADETQFLVITHRKGTMEAADTVYGITMEENGISKLLSMQLK
ncbi:MAG: chromosome segregation protein SMC [Clostridia bacterium]